MTCSLPNFFIPGVDLRKKRLGEDHPEYISSLINLVGLYIHMRKPDVAETLLKQQISFFEKIPGKEPPGYALCLDLLAELYLEKGNYTDSQVFYLKSVAAKKKIFGEKHPEYEAALRKLNSLYKSTGTLNSLYGDMSKAMQGKQPDKIDTKGNPSLNSMDEMLQETEMQRRCEE
jgi:hypothetical protein